jgi:hypothetical protein
MDESFIRILIIAHAILGGIALLSGSVALITPKGNKVHKKGGIVFYYTMLCAAFLAIVISVQPGHVSFFLLVIGLFSSYMIVSGKRILALKFLHTKQKPTDMDAMLPIIMLVAGLIMLGYGSYLKVNSDNNGIVLLVFGAIGSIMAVGDLRIVRTPPEEKRFWLYQHISKMTGGYIAALTAFFVVNGVLPGLWGWLSPTVVGTLYIIYHQRRFRSKGDKILAERKIEF